MILGRFSAKGYKAGKPLLAGIGRLALAGILSACAMDTRLGVLDARYQAPEMPMHFRTPRDGVDLSLSASVNDQDPLFHRRLYRERTDGRDLYLARDTSNHLPEEDIEERFRFTRGAYSLGGAATWQQDALYSGLAAGIEPASRGAWHAGAFFGFSGGPAPLVLSAGGGLFRNRMQRSARFWSRSDAPLLDSLLRTNPDSVYAPDSVAGWTTDWEIRIAVGAMYRIHPHLAPYLIAEGGTVRFWAKPRQGSDYAHVEDASAGLGLEWRPMRAWPVRIEIRSGRTHSVDGWGRAFLQGGLRMTREL